MPHFFQRHAEKDNSTFFNLENYEDAHRAVATVDLSRPLSIGSSQNKPEPVIAATIDHLQEYCQKKRSPCAVFRYGEDEVTNQMPSSKQELSNVISCGFALVDHLINDAFPKDIDYPPCELQDMLNECAKQDLSWKIVKQFQHEFADRARVELPADTEEFTQQMSGLIEKINHHKKCEAEYKTPPRVVFPRGALVAAKDGFFNKPIVELNFVFHGGTARVEKYTEDFFQSLLENSPKLEELQLNLVSCQSHHQALFFEHFLEKLIAQRESKIRILVKGYDGNLIPSKLLLKTEWLQEALATQQTTPEGLVICDPEVTPTSQVRKSDNAISIPYGTKAPLLYLKNLQIPEKALWPLSEVMKTITRTDLAKFSHSPEPIKRGSH